MGNTYHIRKKENQHGIRAARFHILVLNTYQVDTVLNSVLEQDGDHT